MASPAPTAAVMSTGAHGGAWKIIGVCSIAAFVVQLDGSALNVALPQIGRSFGVPLAVLQWVVDAYALLYACLLLSTGAASDRFGPRRVFICGYGLFAAASVICALAWIPEMLIAGRALQGIAGSILVPSSLSLINYACGDDRGLRTRAIGFWTASGGIAVSAGPVIGGLFVSSLGWRSIFLVNIPILPVWHVAGAQLRRTRRRLGAARIRLDRTDFWRSSRSSGSLLESSRAARAAGIRKWSCWAWQFSSCSGPCSCAWNRGAHPRSCRWNCSMSRFSVAPWASASF